MEHARESLEDILALLDGVKGPDGKGNYAAICPAHDDTRPSLSIAAGKEQPWVATCHAGCAQADVLAAIRSLSGSARITPKAKPAPKKVVKIEPEPARRFTSIDSILLMTRGKATPYLYRDAAGVERGMVLRVDGPDGKRISQWRKDPDGLWSPGSLDKPRLLYNLPGIANRKPGSTIYVVEGEKCADRLIAEGFCATTASGGAVGASHADWSPLVGMEVAIVPDEDEAGAKYALAAVKELERLGHRLPVRIVSLPGLSPDSGQDIADWLLIPGNTAEKFCDLVDASPAISMGPVGPAPDPEGDAERDAIRDEGCAETPEDVRRKALLEAVTKQPNLRAQVLAATAAGLPIEELPLWKERDRSVTSTGQRIYTKETLDLLPPVTWLVDGFMPNGQMSMLVGPPASGKSLYVLEITQCIANDLPWNGRKVRGGGVMIYAGERIQGWAERNRAYRLRHGMPLRDKHPVEFVKGCPNLSDVEWRKHEIDLRIRDWVEKYGTPPVLVVMDTVSVALNGLSENDAEAVAPMIRDLREVGDRYGFAWSLLHHTGKAQQGQPLSGMDAIRGSSSFAGNLDAIYLVRKDGDAISTVECVKLSEGEMTGVVACGKIASAPQGIMHEGKALTSAIIEPVSADEATSLHQEADLRRRRQIEEAIHLVLSNTASRVMGVSGGVEGLVALVQSNHPDLKTARATVKDVVQVLIAEGVIEKDPAGKLGLAGDAQERAREQLRAERDRVRAALDAECVTNKDDLCQILRCSNRDRLDRAAQLGVQKIDGRFVIPSGE